MGAIELFTIGPQCVLSVVLGRPFVTRTKCLLPEQNESLTFRKVSKESNKKTLIYCKSWQNLPWT